MDFEAFKPPLLLRNPHVQTVWPTLFRRVSPGDPVPERIDTPDGDFLDLDWYRQGSSRLAVVSHGLEGHSRRPYVLGMVRALQVAGWDVLAWNFRSCGGQMNRLLRFYHSGATEDLDWVIRHALHQGDYRQVDLVGFSIGGNLSLVYLGEQGGGADPRIGRCMAFSVPCDLAHAAEKLAAPENRIYMNRFLKDLREKLRQKSRLFPRQLDLSGLDRIQTFAQFDDRYTAPMHGFRDAEDYWTQCSSRRFIPAIRRPTLIVNALDDPFLTPACFPESEVGGNPHVELETPRWGGHVGFVHWKGEDYWSEARACAFLASESSGSR
ncbi:alpha/beta fold hydrolase [Marinobacteraceae bacterium S3BR75-40.1]